MRIQTFSVSFKDSQELMLVIQEPRECLPSLVIEGSLETLEVGLGLAPWDSGVHNTAGLLSSFCFKIWDLGGSFCFPHHHLEDNVIL